MYLRICCFCASEYVAHENAAFVFEAATIFVRLGGERRCDEVQQTFPPARVQPRNEQYMVGEEADRSVTTFPVLINSLIH